ncbi:MAG: hypothetical protein KF805_08785 [Phycisphaeraceae bacterium]|nr:hypothetical protein [Phycisphaeraceae bacterium]
MSMKNFRAYALFLCSFACCAFGAEPSISKIDRQEAANRTQFKTAKFDGLDTFKYSVWRRAASATVSVELSADFDDSKHEVAIEVSNNFAGAPLSLTLTPSADEPAPGDWALRQLGTKTDAGKKTVQLSIQIADTAPIGLYSFSAVVRLKGNTTAINRVAFPKPVVILFNPWSTRDSVSMEDKASRGEYVENSNGLYRTEVDNKDRTWRFGQFDAITLDTLLRMLSAPDFDKPNEQMSAAVRADPIKFSQAMAKSIDRYVQGDWVLEQFGAGETSPRTWNDSTRLFAKFANPPVKYARCWVFANMLTSLFRCAGLPARSVSCIQSAHERPPANGFVDIYERKVGQNWVTDTNFTLDKAWGFHAWTEAWMKRPDRTDCDGWQVVDGTYTIGPAPVKAIAAKSGGDFDVDFVVGEVNPPIRFWRNNKIDRIDTTSIGKKIITKKIGAAAQEDIVKTYKPGVMPRIPGGDEPSVTWDVPEASSPGQDIVVVAHLSNPGFSPASIDLTVSAYAECYDQTPRGEAWSPESRAIVLAPGESGHSEVFTIPWSAYESFAPVSDHLRIDAFAVCDLLDLGWPKVTYVVFDASDLAVTRTSTAVIAPGETATFAIDFHNTSSSTLSDCELTLEPIGGLDSGGPPEVISLGSVAPGASASWSRSFTAVSPGDGGLAVTLSSGQQPPWSAADSVLVTGCVCDVNQDDFVDDADFVLFANAYDLLTVPPANPLCDFTRDGLVDDADFEFFIGAYENLWCVSDPEE